MLMVVSSLVLDSVVVVGGIAGGFRTFPGA
jgi:hypothetical protein